MGCTNTPAVPDNCAQKCPALEQRVSTPPDIAVGEVTTIGVCACDPWNDRNVHLKAGHTYIFDIQDVKDWKDGGVNADPEKGWLTWMRYPGALFWFLRRVPGQKWYTLVGSMDQNPQTFFPVRRGLEYTPAEDGAFFVFANDMASRYRNNEGTLMLVIRRIK